MDIKSNYFKMNKNDFENYINKLKQSDNTIFLLDKKFFYFQTPYISDLILNANKKLVAFDYIINSFTDFSKKQIIQSFLINEIESTNQIENIYSTKHDIFKIINDASSSKDKKIISISNAYKHLLQTQGENITSYIDIRKLYDIVLKDSIDKADLVDGKYFRKNSVYISNGIKPIYYGINGEENIIKYMNEFIDLYNSNIEIFSKLILSHFIFEYVHPFYDGNGRTGRYLFSNKLYYETKSYFSFVVSFSFHHQKDKYYKAFKQGNDQYEFGCLNTYVETMLLILIDEIENQIKKMNTFKQTITNINIPFKMSKSEEKIYKIIGESTIFSNFGVSNKEIISETNVSKRTLIYVLNKFKSMNLIKETKLGRFNYYTINS